MALQELLDVLESAWKAGIFTKSNMARTHADAIGEAASRGLLSTATGQGEFGREWRITVPGLKLLEQMKGLVNATSFIPPALPGGAKAAEPVVRRDRPRRG